MFGCFHGLHPGKKPGFEDSGSKSAHWENVTLEQASEWFSGISQQNQGNLWTHLDMGDRAGVQKAFSLSLQICSWTQLLDFGGIWHPFGPKLSWEVPQKATNHCCQAWKDKFRAGWVVMGVVVILALRGPECAKMGDSGSKSAQWENITLGQASEWFWGIS